MVDITYIYPRRLALPGDHHGSLLPQDHWLVSTGEINQGIGDRSTGYGLEQRNLPVDLFIHSDRGSQYASELYQLTLLKNGILCSMSGKATALDNTVMEIFYRTLKVELIYQNTYQTRREAQRYISNTSKSSKTKKGCIPLWVTTVQRNTKH